MPSDIPIASNKISTLFNLKISKGFLKKIFLLTLNFLFFFRFFAETATTLILLPVINSISFFLYLIHLVNNYLLDPIQLQQYLNSFSFTCLYQDSLSFLNIL